MDVLSPHLFHSLQGCLVVLYSCMFWIQVEISYHLGLISAFSLGILVPKKDIVLSLALSIFCER